MEQTEDIIGAAVEPHRKWARAEAKKVWKQHGEGKIPVMPEQIIHGLNIPLKEDDLKIDGVSHMDARGNMFIMCKRNSPPTRKRFTLAHELGHLVLEHVHMGQSSQHSNNAQEAEANAFASELLMPSDDLKAFMKQAYRTVKQVTDRYQVSDQAAIIAVQNVKMYTRLLPVASALNLV